MGYGTFLFDGSARAYESLTTATAVGFTPAKYALTSASDSFNPGGTIKAQAVLVTVEVADIRFTIDGSTPTTLATTAVGHQITAGQNYVIRGYDNIQRFLCINDVGSSGAIVHCTYFF